jgi:formate hydrogenlyase transcriptional activator
LTLSSHSDHAFGAKDVCFLEQVAAALAHALANALTHKALRLEEQRLRVLLETGLSIASKLDVRQVFPSISAHVRRIKRHEFASLLLRDQADGVLRVHALDFPLAKGILAVDSITPLDHSPAGNALKLGMPLIFSRGEIAAFGIDGTTQMIDEGIQSLCCVPLTTAKDALGTLNFGSTRADAFRAEDLELFRQIAAQVAVALENERAYREIEQLKNRLAAEKQYLEGEVRTERNFDEIIGDSPALKKALDPVPIVADSDATVLILGETGTGKELIARAIHRMSRRNERNFVKVNCAAIPTGLLESELFGHEKGAFTGAVSQKIGRMELADHGTLFLDEVGEIPLELQPKLLRVLQDHEFERLGGTRTIRVDLRLIAATNRDLGKEVTEHQFRSDLFYRLNVFPIHMPSLRERRGDIPMLVRHFVRFYAARMERHIEIIQAETMSALVNWSWPGNVRELENFIERSVILSDSTLLRAPLAELEIEMLEGGSSDHTLDTAERLHILGILRETGGLLSGPTGAAHRLGLKRTTLQSKMLRLRIVRADYLGPKS